MPVFLKNAQGITRDVSASGLFFWISKSACELGEFVSFSVELKRPVGTMMLRCQGDVVRMEPRTTKIGVAVRIMESQMKLAQG